jgi:hypothetical protein
VYDEKSIIENSFEEKQKFRFEFMEIWKEKQYNFGLFALVYDKLDLDEVQDYFGWSLNIYPWGFSGVMRWIYDYKESSFTIIERWKYSLTLECAASIVCLALKDYKIHTKALAVWLDYIQFLKKLAVENKRRNFKSIESCEKWGFK